ncbi:putative nucleotidyltransferase substrate binding domain-containing protein [Pseudonocardia hispaniensis]|uniref:Nucleotidyltransferase substrate binding domain-containing protein n=1 Tax=Pseudonocardia hispaniensis TaxID=904933 RepID=A0ABW1IYU0_9PSEU
MADIAEFLRAHPPFDTADAQELRELAAAAELEFHPAGSTIFSQGADPIDHLRVIRTGAVEIVHDTHLLDLLGPGELFGHASMLSGLPTGFAAVAAEDTLCYRIPAQSVRPLLGKPAGLRFVTRSLLSSALRHWPGVEAALNPAQRPVADLLRGPPVLCSPGLSLREVAERMSASAATSAVVDLGAGRLGILTDRDLRQRVVAAGLDTSAPVTEAMSAPAYTVPADRLGGEALLDMLDRGIRHLPVLSPTGRVLGVLEDSDLVAVTTRSSFHLRAAIARAEDVGALVDAAARLRPTIIGLHDAKVAASDISAIYSVVADVLTRRLIDFAIRELGAPPSPFSWLALGSLARREAVPSSDVDSALVWFGPDSDPAAAAAVRAIADRVMTGLAACGFPADRNGAVASNPLFARSAAGWEAVTRGWLTDPTQEKALVLVSLVVDGRPVWGLRHPRSVPDVFRSAHRHPDLLRLLARFALSHRPPTGFLRDFVVEHSGERRGQLDLKKGGIVPIVDLARWAGMAAGVTSASTPVRLRAAAEAGTLDAEARTLQEAFDLIVELRMQHQVGQLRAGTPPDDYVRPGELSQLTRASLREAFRAIASVQRRVASTLQLGVW